MNPGDIARLREGNAENPAALAAQAMTCIAMPRTSTLDVVGQVTPSGSATVQTLPPGLRYPPDVRSSSLVALPFPPGDGLYGAQPDAGDYYGVQPGAMAARGEQAALIVSLDALIRMSSNPFFPHLLQRVDEGIASPAAAPK